MAQATTPAFFRNSAVTQCGSYVRRWRGNASTPAPTAVHILHTPTRVRVFRECIIQNNFQYIDRLHFGFDIEGLPVVSWKSPAGPEFSWRSLAWWYFHSLMVGSWWLLFSWSSRVFAPYGPQRPPLFVDLRWHIYRGSSP